MLGWSCVGSPWWCCPTVLTDDGLSPIARHKITVMVRHTVSTAAGVAVAVRGILLAVWCRKSRLWSVGT